MLRIFGLLRLTRCSFGNNDDDDDDVSLSKSDGNNIGVWTVGKIQELTE
jgi:hypothetical protein